MGNNIGSFCEEPYLPQTTAFSAQAQTHAIGLLSPSPSNFPISPYFADLCPSQHIYHSGGCHAGYRNLNNKNTACCNVKPSENVKPCVKNTTAQRDQIKDVFIAHGVSSGETLTLRGFNITVAESIRGVLNADAAEDITLSELQGATVSLTTKTGDVSMRHAVDSKVQVKGGNQSLIEIGSAVGCHIYIEGHINVTGQLRNCQMTYKGTLQCSQQPIACTLLQT